ncbi:MAG TPA: M20/M25/M40 family metallo-hydrolase [Gemmatimonadales bacterium]|nr:M20/M25/M40 family metallo-hydrolase [Gemmatimonadales bacterium]
MDPIELTKTLVAIESPTFHEGPALAYLAGVLERAGYRVTRQSVPTAAGVAAPRVIDASPPGERWNLYAWREPPAVVFSTHLDCVPPYVPLGEDDEWIYGRGSCDAKGIAAAMVAAAERLAEAGERRVGLLFVVGEENGSDGAHAAHALEPRGQFFINGEPTENLLCIGQKGSLRIDLEATGRAAHSAYPAEGQSAIIPLLETLRTIRRLPLAFDPVLGESSLNIGTIRGGVAPNVIPAHAAAQILVRTVGPTKEFKEQVRLAADPAVSVSAEVEIPAYKGEGLPGWETTVVGYASDLPFFRNWGRRYQLGPGSIRVAHTDRERIAKGELLRGVELYVKLANDLLASEGAAGERPAGEPSASEPARKTR